VEPESGASLSLLVDGMDSTVMRWVLRGFRAWAVLDRAGWQVSQRVEVPEGVDLEYRPPYSPELQPDVAVGEGGGGPPVL